jgi:FkbM family methyltransferase
LTLNKGRGAFVDVGVNIGQTPIKVVSVAENGFSYVGFEPNPSAVFYVEKLIQMIDFKSASVIPVGLSLESKVLKMSLSDCVDSGATVVNGFRDADFHSSSIYVSVFRGDDVLNELGITAISIVKIDVEGSEIGVIKGLAGISSSAKPFVLCEILPPVDHFPDFVNQGRLSHVRRLESEIRSLGYEIFQITSDCMFIKVDDIHSTAHGVTPDYVFVPADRAHILSSAPVH